MDIDMMEGEALAAAFNEVVLGEAKPTQESAPFGTVYSDGGNWYWSAQGWAPLPLDGNQMMKGVRAMAERGWWFGAGGPWDDGRYEALFQAYAGDPKLITTRSQEYWAKGIKLEIATARAALKAMRAEEVSEI